MTDYDIEPTRPTDFRQGPGKFRFDFSQLTRKGASFFVAKKENETKGRLQSIACSSAKARRLPYKIKTELRVEDGISGVRIWRL